MPLKDLLKKKDKIANEGSTGTVNTTTTTTTTASRSYSNSNSNTRRTAPLVVPPPRLSPSVPEFQFLRTTTSTQETIEPPSFPGDPIRYDKPLLSPDSHRRFARFRSKSNAGAQQQQLQQSAGTGTGTGTGTGAVTGTGAGTGGWQASGGPEDQGVSANTNAKGTLAERLHFGRTRSASSINVPDNLPDVGGDGVARTEEEEAKWETRATVMVTEGLAAHGSGGPSQPGTPSFEHADFGAVRPGSSGARGRTGSVGTPRDEVCMFVFDIVGGGKKEYADGVL